MQKHTLTGFFDGTGWSGFGLDGEEVEELEKALA